jgi:hypothetical protein
MSRMWVVGAPLARPVGVEQSGKEDGMGRDVVGNCQRCGQVVREDHSHVMLVPVGRGRMFFHAGCEPIRTAGDAADERLGGRPVDLARAADAATEL